MQSIRAVFKKAFFLLHIVFLYVIPFLYFSVPMGMGKPFPVDYKNMNMDDKIKVMFVGMCPLIVGLLFYIAYLKMKNNRYLEKQE